MGLWSKIKKAAKKVWRAAKAVVRAAIRIAVVLITVPFKVFDLVFGWIGWPPKKMKLHIAVLSSANGPLISDLQELKPSIDLLKRVMKDRCNINVHPYSSGNKNEIDKWAQIITKVAPTPALKVHCDLGAAWDELGEAGQFFSKHTAGWVSGFIPISLAFPITVFIVEEVSAKIGCAVPVLTDYATVSASAIRNRDSSTLAHEVAHRCNLWHYDKKNNLAYHSSDRVPPYWLTWWQRNLVRSSRHATYLF
jgi:hypothetical protein